MKFVPLYVGRVSATFELVNESVYYAPEPFDVSLDGKIVLFGETHNVFSLFGLEPDKEYEVGIKDERAVIRTRPCSVVFNVRDFIDNRCRDDTLSFQAAIMALPPGGILEVPQGTYRVSSLFLKSEMTLLLDKGAVVLGSPRLEDYGYMPGEISYPDPEKPKLQLTAWEGNPKSGFTSIVGAYNAHDIEIVGQGTVDGQAQLSEFWKDTKNLPYARPRLFFFNNCRDVNLVGIKVCNSPSWTVHPYFCERIGFYNLDISNPKDAPNTDGLDPESCDGVKIVGVRFSVGDDCVALKSGKIYLGSTFKRPTQNVEIRNCLMHEGHGGIVLGSEVGAGVKDIAVERCIFEKTDRGLRIKTRRGRGKDSVIDGIVFRNILMNGVLTPLVINMYYFCDPDGHSELVRSREYRPVDETTPRLGKFTFEGIRAVDAHYALGWFFGLPEAPIGEIVIRNSTFTVADEAGSGMPAMMDDIKPQTKRGFVFYNVKKYTLSNVEISGCEGSAVFSDRSGTGQET